MITASGDSRWADCESLVTPRCLPRRADEDRPQVRRNEKKREENRTDNRCQHHICHSNKRVPMCRGVVESSGSWLPMTGNCNWVAEVTVAN